MYYGKSLILRDSSADAMMETGQYFGEQLRATGCNYQELADKSEFLDFFITCPHKHFGKLFVKILIKEFLFLQNSTKCVIP